MATGAPHTCLGAPHSNLGCSCAHFHRQLPAAHEQDLPLCQASHSAKCEVCGGFHTVQTARPAPGAAPDHSVVRKVDVRRVQQVLQQVLGRERQLALVPLP